MQTFLTISISFLKLFLAVTSDPKKSHISTMTENRRGWGENVEQYSVYSQSADMGGGGGRNKTVCK